MKKLSRSLFFVVVILSLIATPVMAAPPDHAGTGGRPDHANSNHDRNDPDDDGHGPDRGDGTRDDGDWNNGCGNDWDREDDNEGWCKPSKPVKPIKPIVIKTHPTCKLSATGNVVELFPEGWIPSMGEKALIAEARYELEHTLQLGETVTVFFWTPTYGHSHYAHYEAVTCTGENILVVERKEVRHRGTFLPR